jgi:hypothetical protein
VFPHRSGLFPQDFPASGGCLPWRISATCGNGPFKKAEKKFLFSGFLIIFTP